MTAYQNWQTEFAPEPVLPETGGQSSPLLGKAAPDFALPLLGGGQFKSAIHLHAALGKQLRPLTEKARVRVDFLSAIGLPAANEHPQRLGGRRGDGQPSGEDREE